MIKTLNLGGERMQWVGGISSGISILGGGGGGGDFIAGMHHIFGVCVCACNIFTLNLSEGSLEFQLPFSKAI